MITQSSWIPLQDISEIFMLPVEQLADWVAEDKLPSLLSSDGILIWFGGFQMVLPNLIDLVADLDALYQGE